MSGIALAFAAGVGFGMFQAVSRKTNSGLDAYRATFGLLAVGTAGMTVISLLTQDVSRSAAHRWPLSPTSRRPASFTSSLAGRC